MEYVIIFIAFIAGCVFHSKFLTNDNHSDFDAEKIALKAKISELQKSESEMQELKTRCMDLQRKNDRIETEYRIKRSTLEAEYRMKKAVVEAEFNKKVSAMEEENQTARSTYRYQLQKKEEEFNNIILEKERVLNYYKAGFDERLHKNIQQIEAKYNNKLKELERKEISFNSLLNGEKLKLERENGKELLKLRQDALKEVSVIMQDLKRKKLIAVLKNILINRYLQEAEHLKSIAETEEYTLRLKVNEIPVLSAFIADINEVQDKRISDWFLIRRYKSEKAADFIKARKKEMRELRTENKNLQYKILAYESFFPILKDYDNEPISAKPDIPDYDDEKGDRAHYWVTDTEYKSLSVTERNQRALDNYWNRKNRTHSEIGADYEKSIGYWEYEKKGWEVEYFGIDKGLEDMGRDLICISPDKRTTHIVQCKCWSSKKEIHENHINQLFGTTVRYVLEHTGSRSIEDFVKLLENGTIVPVFYTKTKLSPTAKSFAKSLGIEVHEEVEMKMYPMVKCNVSRRSQERIYHLPFDQQYDTIKIEPPDEFIAMTVAEAEQAGFRRAFKWRGK